MKRQLKKWCSKLWGKNNLGMIFVGEDHLGGLVAQDEEDDILEGHKPIKVVEDEEEECR